MNHAFKMMAVVLALGVLVLQGCQTSSPIKYTISNYDAIKYTISNYDDLSICNRATKFHKGKKVWLSTLSVYSDYISEAKRRGLDCGVKDNSTTIASNQTKNPSNRPLATEGKIQILSYACNNKYDWSKDAYYNLYVVEAKKRKLTCLDFLEHQIKSKNNSYKKIRGEYYKLEESYRDGTYGVKSGQGINIYLKNISELDICNFLNLTKNTITKKMLGFELKKRNLNCRLKNKTGNIIASKPKITKPSISSSELDAERQKRKELERKLALLESKQKQEQKRINTDNQIPTISAFTKQDGSNATISGRVTDNTEVAEVLIDGQVQELKSNGTFETDFYVPRSGKTIKIVAYDTKGNKASKILKLERSNIQQASGPSFEALNPSVKKVKSNPNALALIIGISDYSKTSAQAIYADSDAKMFYDYATMKLGISPSNIKELVNNKADRVEIALAVKDWISRSTKQNKTDIYLFFAGHGLATSDSKDMFLLPYDGLPRLLQDSAIKRDQLFTDIQQANPRSVTVFLDTCYSGTTRGTDMLIASRPIAIRALEQSIPDNFTVFSAAAGDQTSKPLEEAKHGMFSYFLMKGMEGDADANNDNKITARELHAYVEQNVVQQSSGSQTPELQGDKDRVLVQFN